MRFLIESVVHPYNSSYSLEEIPFYFIREIRVPYDYEPDNSSPYFSDAYVNTTFCRLDMAA